MQLTNRTTLILDRQNNVLCFTNHLFLVVTLYVRYNSLTFERGELYVYFNYIKDGAN